MKRNKEIYPSVFRYYKSVKKQSYKFIGFIVNGSRYRWHLKLTHVFKWYKKGINY